MMARTPARLRRGYGLRLFGAVMVVWLLAPVVAAIPMSFTGEKSFVFPPKSWSLRWFESLFEDPEWTAAMWTSLRIGALVVVISVIFGSMAALALDRLQFRGKATLQGFLIAPLIVPIVILAAGVYAVFLPWKLAGTDVGFVLAHSALSLPFVIVTVGTSLQGFDHRLEQAAASLGAAPVATFFQVTLPLILPGVIAGAIFAFITSFDELVVSLFLAGPTKRTVPVQMYDSLNQIDPTIAAASTFLLVVTTGLILLAMLLNRRVRRGEL
jgi:putative spermidine/putrescine transport system permease protein